MYIINATYTNFNYRMKTLKQTNKIKNNTTFKNDGTIMCNGSFEAQTFAINYKLSRLSHDTN